MFLSGSYRNLLKDKKWLSEVKASSSVDLSKSFRDISVRRHSLTNSKEKPTSDIESSHEGFLSESTTQPFSCDEEDFAKCDICGRFQIPTGSYLRLRSQQKAKKRQRKKQKPAKQSEKFHEFDVNSCSAEEDKSEPKWVLEYTANKETQSNLLLRRVLVAEEESFSSPSRRTVVFDNSACIDKLSLWRNAIYEELKDRNCRSYIYRRFPTHLTCRHCAEEMQGNLHHHIQTSPEKPDANQNGSTVLSSSFNHSGDSQQTSWRRKIIYDLKIRNCRTLKFLNSHRRSQTPQKKRYFWQRKQKQQLSSTNQIVHVTEENWEDYTVISDDEAGVRKAFVKLGVGYHL